MVRSPDVVTTAAGLRAAMPQLADDSYAEARSVNAVILMIGAATLLFALAVAPACNLGKATTTIIGQTGAAVAGASWFVLTMPTCPRCRRCRHCRRCARQRR